jgi:hypothetical protein
LSCSPVLLRASASLRESHRNRRARRLSAVRANPTIKICKIPEWLQFITCTDRLDYPADDEITISARLREAAMNPASDPSNLAAGCSKLMLAVEPAFGIAIWE